MTEPRMLRTIRWLVDAALLAVCCFLLARSANGIYEALQSSPPPPTHETLASPAPRKPRTWSDREVILTRNLFDASLLAPVEPPPPPVEEVEETELPLGLLGTISSSRAELGWAAVWDAESRESLVVKPGDEVGGGRATVLQIERERVLLSENGAIRELVPDDDGEYLPPRRPAPRRKARTSNRRFGRRGRR